MDTPADSFPNARMNWEQERVTLGRHYLRDLETMWGELLKLAAVVELSLSSSVRALLDRRADLAEQVTGDETSINGWEVRIEQQCLKVLALHQPVASDLRRVAAALKINSDLERMADLAVHIAKRARKLSKRKEIAIPQNLETLALESLAAVRDALDALARSDAALARRVIASDTQVDRLRGSILKQLKHAIVERPDQVNSYLRLINTARNIERIADHATNIAEAVVYLIEGDIIRHVADRRGAKKRDEDPTTRVVD